MKRGLALSALLSFCLGTASTVLAVGHDIDCKDCHSVHGAKGAYIFSVAPDTSEQQPGGGKLAPEQIDALCLGCHNDKTGISPVHLKTSHPTGMIPKKLKVPDFLLRKGAFSCVSCHDPHPANTNFKYLIVNTNNGKSMGVFCAKCHPAQSDPDIKAKAAGLAVRTDPNPAPAAAPATPAKPDAKPDAKPGDQPQTPAGQKKS